MNENRPKTKLFGLKKKQINQFLRDLEQDMLLENEKIQEEISYWDFEIERAEKEMIELEKALNQQHADGELDRAKERLPYILSWMDQQFEREIEEIEAVNHLEITDKKKELELIELEIQNGSQLLQRLINQFTKGIEHLDDISDIEETLSKEFSIVGDKNLECFTPEPVLNSRFESTSDFWDDSSSFLLKQADYQFDTPLVDSQEREMSVKTPKYGDEETSKPDIVEANLDGPEPETLQKDIPIKSSANESEGIKHEIDHIKKRYIVGKLAGKDLHDSFGHLIIKKYDIISEEVVEKANQAGMLADLIVHMKIPGIGESQNE